jgi:cytochrome b involved in lipid metabolism
MTKLIVVSTIILGVLGGIWEVRRMTQGRKPKEIVANQASQETKTADKCLITIEGKQYDVSDFRSKHKGGNIFECGSDMTERFVKKHGMDWKRLESYLVK